MRCEHALRRYLRHLEVLHRSARTIEAEAERLGRFLAYLGGLGVVEVEGIGRDAARDYPEELSQALTRQGDRLRVTTQRNCLIAARSWLKWLHRDGLTAVDLSAAIELPREEELLPKEVIEPSEMRRLLAATEGTSPLRLRDRAMLEVLYSTGIRVSELTALRVTDVLLEDGFVHVRRGKGGKDRVVPLGVIAGVEVQRYLADGRPWLVHAGAARERASREAELEVLFLSARGRALTRRSVAQRIEQLVRDAGIRKHVTAHCFRVTCVTGMLRNGASTRYLQEMLGHASVASLDPYLRLTAVELKEMHTRFHPRERIG